MRLLHNRVFLAFGIATLIFLVVSGLIWFWEYVMEWAEGILAFGLLFFLISSVMKTKHLLVACDPDQRSDIGTLFL